MPGEPRDKQLDISISENILTQKGNWSLFTLKMNEKSSH
jgi:hypothetical protein